METTTLSEWGRTWHSLFITTKYLLFGFAGVAAAALSGMGNAGEAPGLLSFYLHLISECALGFVLSAGCLFVVEFFRRIMLMPDGRDSHTKYQFDRKNPRLAKLSPKVEAVAHFTVFLLCVCLLAYPLKQIAGVLAKQDPLIMTVVCEASFRKHVTIPGYRLHERCQEFLGEKGKPDETHFLWKKELQQKSSS